MKHVLLMFAMVFLTVVSAPALANDTQEQIAQYQTVLAKIQEDTSVEAFSADFEMVQKWLKEAEVLAANGDRDAASKRLRRVDLGVELVRALAASAQIRQAAQEQEEAAHKAPETIAELEGEVESLTKKKRELEQELQRLR